MIKKKYCYHIAVGLLSSMLCVSMCPTSVFATNKIAEVESVSSGSITYAISDEIQVDGDGSDWKGYTLLSSTDSGCSGWIVIKDSDNYYFYAKGNDIPKSLGITYADGTQGNANGIQMTWDYSEVKDGWYQNIAGAEIAKADDMVELSIPASFFSNQEFTLSYCGVELASSSIEGIGDADWVDGDTEENEADTEDEEIKETQPAYEGIVIDGQFHDWDAVSKIEVSNEAINSTAMIFDGDWVYVYLSAPLNYSVSNAGSHGNGKYEIKTDLGRTLVFQINSDGTISGIEGAQIAHSDLTWGQEEYYYEIAIPKSALPQYLKTISFGLYLGETFVSDVANLQDEEEEKEFSGIVYDGQYDDWDYYPHTVIQYATAGTQENVPDAEGALYVDGSTLYGHVMTTMPAHLQEAGGEFSAAVTIQVNGEKNYYPRLVKVDADGNIDWNTNVQGLSEGNYEFYLVDLQGWASAKTIDELQQQGNDLFGKMHMTIGVSSDEMEFQVDIEALARKFGMDANDIKTLGAQFGRIGQQWIQTAGTSTGAYVGVGLSMAVVGGVFVYRKRKGETIGI